MADPASAPPGTGDRGAGLRLLGAVLLTALTAFLALPLTLAPPEPGAAEPADAAFAAPGRLAELVAPDVWTGDGDGAGSGDGPGAEAGRDGGADDDARLLREAWLREHPRAVPRARLHVGLLPLALAVLGLVAARGATALGARLVLVAALAVALGALGPRPPEQLTWALAGTQVALAVLAGLGLLTLRPLDEQPPTGPPLVVGTAWVVLAGVLGALAAWAGSAETRELLAPTLERLPEGFPVTAADRARTAAHLVATLDRAAVFAFAAMTALLLHLKGRGVLTLVLVLAVSALELLAARGLVLVGWPG